jgi:hypothetical protein
MPIIAPVGREEDFETGTAAGVVLVVVGGAVGAAVAPVYVVVLTGARVSGRNDCPGLNPSVVFWVYAN